MPTYDLYNTSLDNKTAKLTLLVHGQVTIIFVVSVYLFVCLSLCLFVQSFSQPSLIRFRSNQDTLYVWVQLCPLEYTGCATPGGWVTPKNLYF